VTRDSQTFSKEFHKNRLAPVVTPYFKVVKVVKSSSTFRHFVIRSTQNFINLDL